MLIELFTLILTFSFAVSCPPSLSLSPNNHCTCKEVTGYRMRGKEVEVECRNVKYPDDLKASIREFEGLHIDKLKITKSDLRYVPHDLFRGMKISILSFQESSIKSYSDTDIALEGLEGLYTLQFYQCKELDSLDWSLFKNLDGMSLLFIQQSDLKIIQGDIRDGSHLKLHYVAIQHTDVSKIGDHAFASFDGLENFEIAYSLVSEVKRSMLPNPANKLRTIDLWDNKLTAIPDDFFTNMPALQRVILAKNKLRTLKEETFEPIWDNLHYFNAKDNEIICDCRLTWILEKPRRNRTSDNVICFEPSEFRGTLVMDVSPCQLESTSVMKTNEEMNDSSSNVIQNSIFCFFLNVLLSFWGLM